MSSSWAYGAVACGQLPSPQIVGQTRPVGQYWLIIIIIIKITWGNSLNMGKICYKRVENLDGGFKQ
jgi:hypothetical protein